MISEKGEISINGDGNEASSYTVTFMAVADCENGDPTITITVE
jgi:hypothetical protein